ncbi:MAG: hypothetical protein US58_C0014G0018 [Candidatus Magasanikbacteria bacterium GW2011_GWA2_37_8]|uniref:Uncharacterized protein n=1 Tax=Candidatus Magasanikbacteria bacterium GW2011_GWA2_37_8 TaxID=1619036 RepID=A0A0G0KJA5_9BACT|nr:MAG: hypothetical protein US58_C0014G0018 [Candidatus Magasanikbacteria bacterium GW2011_GWA2_37_8]
MEAGWFNFKPRKYIVEHLSCEKQARDLLEIYNKYYGLDFESGFNEKIIRPGNWVNNYFYNKIFVKLKDFIKNIKQYI